MKSDVDVAVATIGFTISEGKFSLFFGCKLEVPDLTQFDP
jgi:hypothetical protein